MKIVEAKKPWAGKAWVGSHIVDECIKNKEPLRIYHNKEYMEVAVDELASRIEHPAKEEYRHRDGRPGTYKLVGFVWKPVTV